jgi:hypothetical protein
VSEAGRLDGRRRGIAAGATALLAAAAALAVWCGTPHHLGLSPDSVAYLRAAEQWLATGAAPRGTAQWPPGYPLLLAGGTATGLAPLQAARLLHALLLALNVVLFALLARRVAPMAWAALLLAALVALQPVWLRPHLVLWSEPAFLALMLADLLLLQALQQRVTAGRLAALAGVAAAALLLRYAGGFLLVLNATVLAWWLPRQQAGRRWGIALAASVVSALPLAAWLAWRQLAGASAPRQLAWHPPDAGALRALGATVAVWFQAPAAWWWAGLALLCAALAAGWRARAQPGSPARLLAAALIAYLAFLTLSLTGFDANMPLDDRLLLPVFTLLVLLLLAGANHARHPAARAAWLLPLVLLLPGAADGTRLWLASRHDGIGLASRQMQQMPVLPRLARFAPAWRIYTNAPELFTVHLRREATMLPRGIEPRNRGRNPDFGAQMDLMVARADAIVWFQAMQFRTYLPPPEVIDRLPGFRRSYQDADAVVWTRTPTP